MAAWLNAADAQQIVFTHGATSALNLLAYGLEHRFEAGDEIAVSALEHHANLLPWQQLAQRHDLRLVVLPLDIHGHIDLDQAADERRHLRRLPWQRSKSPEPHTQPTCHEILNLIDRFETAKRLAAERVLARVEDLAAVVGARGPALREEPAHQR